MAFLKVRAVAIVLARLVGRTGAVHRGPLTRRIARAALARVTGRWRWLRWLFR